MSIQSRRVFIGAIGKGAAATAAVSTFGTLSLVASTEEAEAGRRGGFGRSRSYTPSRRRIRKRKRKDDEERNSSRSGGVVVVPGSGSGSDEDSGSSDLFVGTMIAACAGMVYMFLKS